MDNALASGLLEAVTELHRFLAGFERANHGAIIDTLVAKIGAPDERLV